jgi:hypothetical protein
MECPAGAHEARPALTLFHWSIRQMRMVFAVGPPEAQQRVPPGAPVGQSPILRQAAFGTSFSPLGHDPQCEEPSDPTRRPLQFARLIARPGTHEQGSGLARMDPRREHLALARRHVSEAVARLTKQRARVFELCVCRLPNNEGERLLTLMEETFELMLQHERMLEAEVEGPIQGFNLHLSRAA